MELFDAAKIRMKPKLQRGISRRLEETPAQDDVFSAAFRHDILVAADSQLGQDQLASIRQQLSDAWGSENVVAVESSSLPNLPRDGPYVLVQEKIFRPYRLKSHSGLRIAGEYPSSLSVAVPSRGPHSHGKRSEIEGYRFAIKDCFEVAGLRATVGCRTYYAVNERATTTAPIIGKLIEVGAHLLGTLKLGSLNTKEEPAESADFQASFNPRGDGYQSASSSSGGSGAAAASYEWLDFTLGTDTTGSSRRPAYANGVFQMRLSHDAVTQEGIIPSWRPFDAPAIFSREMDIIRKSPMYCNLSLTLAKPTRLVYLEDYYPLSDKRQQDLFEQLFTDIESMYSITRARISLSDLWSERKPAGTSHTSLSCYMHNIGILSFCYGLYHQLDAFRTNYHEQYGAEPYVNPTTRWRWDAATNITAEQYEEAVDRLKVYKKWLLEDVLQSADHETLVVLPVSEQIPDPRDQPAALPSAPSATQQLWLSPILGAPEISVPIGEIDDFSRITRQYEPLPVIATVLGLPGTDIALVENMATVLNHTGRGVKAGTGSSMYSTYGSRESVFVRHTEAKKPPPPKQASCPAA
ncbi:hypothetical protein PV05_06103 [Exophiala xenobiotica]|uniref:Amidase domain-containing protein n=1 Tax=Exophiala xenobiotica TaxID=348802 RepID=A0A0D2D5G0_9EURO|nr:uncharacterized protein PV05_06103 [Exophiala xenobiotica]KIW57562.1 hypothetical protein PV05_06103 [Exophiala xenobiotica]